MTFWSCGAEASLPPSSEPPTCPEAGRGAGLRHGDFFNAWNQTALERLVTGCLNALRHCGRGF